MIVDESAYHYVWTAFQALLPVAIAAFFAGLVLAWLIWGLIWRKGGE